MADIRAPNWPAVRPPTMPAARPDARAEAQRAFFQAALAGKVEALAPSAAPVRAPDLTVQLPPAAPEKILSPGSIIDIRV
jgi:hypothetical protein